MTTTEPTTATGRGEGSPAPPPPRRRASSRFSAAHLVIVVAALAAVVLNYAALRARDETVRVAVVAAEVAVGAPVLASDLTLADVRVPDAVLSTLLTAELVGDLDGWVAATPLAPGEVVRLRDLQRASAPQEQRAMSIPIDPSHAVAGALSPGDRVDVIEVEGRTASYLLTDAEVLDVPDTAPSGIQAGLRTFSVTIAVDDEAALRLAVAIRAGQLEIVRSTGASAATAGPFDADPPADDEEGGDR